MANIANDANDGDVVLVAGADLATERGLGRRVETLCEGGIDDGYFGLPFCVGGSEFATDEERLMKGGKVSGGNPRLLEVQVFVFGGLISLYGKLELLVFPASSASSVPAALSTPGIRRRASRAAPWICGARSSP